jgi:hypothetical protein
MFCFQNVIYMLFTVYKYEKEGGNKLKIKTVAGFRFVSTRSLGGFYWIVCEGDSAYQTAVPEWKEGKAGIIFKLSDRWKVKDELRDCQHPEEAARPPPPPPPQNPDINHLRTKRNPFYLKAQSVPRSKHLPPRL